MPNILIYGSLVYTYILILPFGLHLYGLISGEGINKDPAITCLGRGGANQS